MGRGDMIPPRSFIRDLELLIPPMPEEKGLIFVDWKFSTIWDPITQRWEIVTPAPVSVFRRGYVEAFLVETQNGGFAPLDNRALRELRMLVWEKNHMVDLSRHLTNQEVAYADRLARVNRQTQAKFQEAGKKCDKFRTTKTFT